MNSKFQHSNIFPKNPMLLCICGSSGSGKTFLTFKMLTTEGLLDYTNLYIYTSTPEQDYYKFLKGLEFLSKDDVSSLFNVYNNDDEVQNNPIEDLLEEKILQSNKNKIPTGIKVLITKNIGDLDLRKIDSSKKNLIIFDDCVTQKDQTIQTQFFTKGRHHNCHCIYQSQSFYGMDSQFIRKNSNCFILFELSDRDLSHIIQSINHGMDKNEFKNICKETWNNPDDYGYTFINIRKKRGERVLTNIFD